MVKSFELNPTHENLIKTLVENLLDRNDGVWHFARLCNGIENKCSIALEAKWGEGKTFFIRHVQMLIESFNPFFTTITEEDKITIQTLYSSYIGTGENAAVFDAQVCVYYDAWANDNDGDPILSLIYAILQSVAQNYKFKNSIDGIETAALIADFFTGKNASDIYALKQKTDPLAELKAQREIFTLVNRLVDDLLNEQGNRLIVFIDELDRCKPDYAVQLLERIKHYFSNERITFVFSVNIDELQHTIKCHYGEGFDACRYLDRFFDFRISLPPANMTRYYQRIGLDKSEAFEKACKVVVREYGLGIRETEKFFRMAKIAAYKPTHGAQWGFDDENGKLFARCFIVPIIIGLRMVDMKKYSDFIEGNDPQPMVSILTKGDFEHTITSLLRNEPTRMTNDEITVSSIESILTDTYYAIFGTNEKQSWEAKKIGRCAFSVDTKEDLLQLASMLSNQAQYD